MLIYNTHEAKSQLSKLIALTLAGETVVIANAGKPTITLSPYLSSKPAKKIKKNPLLEMAGAAGKIKSSKNLAKKVDEIYLRD